RGAAGPAAGAAAQGRLPPLKGEGMDFFREIPVNQAQAEAMARGLFAVAKADGVHERQLALISSFYADVGGSARPLSELEPRADTVPTELAATLGTGEHAQLFLKTALLLAWADGSVSAEERACIGRYANALGTGKDALATLEDGVKDYLLGHLSHVQNVDATRK